MTNITAHEPPGYVGTEGHWMNIAEALARWAVETPDAPAVRQWDEQRSYARLCAEAAELAARITACGVGPEDRVGLYLDRTPALVSAVVGTLFSGAAYVPLERTSPPDRLRAMVADADVRVVVADTELPWQDDTLTVLTPPDAGAHAPGNADGSLPRSMHPDSLAYVLYTSGSTGEPKGVLCTHANVTDFVRSFLDETALGRDMRTLAASSAGFDATTIDLLVTLSGGGCVQLAGEADRLDSARLTRFVLNHRVNLGFLTPTVLNLLDPASVPDWTVVVTGGEVVPPEMVAEWTRDAPRRRLINIYGPTETTVCVTTAELAGRYPAAVPIGTETRGHQVHIVDEWFREVRDGAVGELVVSGPGITRGYLDRPGLTARRFVPDPFSAVPGARLYRTGDLASRLGDGSIAYHGRTDRQVKVRGQRIEPGEVESVLRGHPEVREVAVEAVPLGAGDAPTELVAFAVLDGAPADTELIEYAQGRLSPAMLPRRVFALERLPRTDSGKVDRRALVEQASGGAADRVEARTELPADPAAAAVWRTWRLVLGSTPDEDSDFFTAGGHSIAAMRMAASLRAELHVDISTADVFDARTFSLLTERAAAAAGLSDPDLSVENSPMLTPSQRRLWFMDQLAPEAAPYNIAMACRIRGELDVGALEAALHAVERRQEVLRWRIAAHDGVPHAFLAQPRDAALPVVDLVAEHHTEHATERGLRERLAEDARRVFDLAEQPPWQARLYRLASGDHALAVTVHHAVFDGWSQVVFWRDLEAAYRQALSGRAGLAPPPACYADYAAWRIRRDQARGDADLAWWREHLRGAPTVVDLPRDRPRPAVGTYAGAEARATLTAPACAAVGGLAEELGVTAASVLLTACNELLHRMTGQAEHVLGMVVADRGLAAFDDVAGFFIDTVPVRLPARAPDFRRAVSRCAMEMRQAAAHPAAPLERIVDALELGRDTSRAPLVQVLFNVLNFPEATPRLPGTDCEEVTVDKPGSPFDITVYLTSSEGRWAFETVYNPDLYEPARIEGMLAALAELAGELAAHPDTAPESVATHLPSAPVRTPAPVAMATGTTAPPHRPQPLQPAGEAAGATERLISRVWCEILGLDSVGAGDNFFDIGGNSLALTTVRERLMAATGRNVPLVELFRHPNVRALAAHLDGESGRPELDRAAARASARRNRARRPPTSPTPHRPQEDKE